LSDDRWLCVKLRDVASGISVLRTGTKLLRDLERAVWPG
jgi:hypothetical protein